MDNLFLYTKHDVVKLRHSVLHGYAIIDRSIVINTDGLLKYQDGVKNSMLPEDGRFAGIFRSETDQGYVIRTDIHGQEMLYVYRKNDEWAISNSFLLLANYAASKGKINFYKPAALNFLLKTGTHIGEQLLSQKTMIEEILILPVNAELLVNTITGSLVQKNKSIKEIFDLQGFNYEENLSAFLAEGKGLMKALRGMNAPLQLNLSGGYDSRLVLGMLYDSNCNNQNLFISSDINRAADFKIAKQICKKLELPLNSYKSKAVKRSRFKAEDSFKLFMLSCAGTYLPIYPLGDYYLKENYNLRLTGDYSADASHFRGNATFNGNMVKISDDIKNYLKSYDGVNEVLNDFQSNFDILGIKMDDILAAPLYYLSNRARHHCGRHWYKSIGGSYLITPLTSKRFTLLNLHSYLYNDNEDKLFTDLFCALGDWAVDTPFESAKGNLKKELIESSNFHGPSVIQPIDYEVFGNFYDEKKNFASLTNELPIKGRMKSGDFEKLLVSTFKNIDINRYSDIFKAEDFNRMYSEIGRAGNCSHGYRAVTHLLFVDTIKSLTN